MAAMKATCLNVLLVITMLFAFVGQGWANSAMSCEMATASHQSHTSLMMDHESMSHENMNHVMMSHENMKNDESCCESECPCPTSACSTASIIHSEYLAEHINLVNDLVIIQDVNRTQSLPSSLFRPPIFS